MIIRLFPLLFLVFVLACGPSKNPPEAPQQIEFDAQKFLSGTCESAARYADALDLLNKSDLKSIDLAIAAYRNSIPDSALNKNIMADSMLVCLNDFISSVIQQFDTESLNGNDVLMGHLRAGDQNNQTSEFMNNLAQHGITLSTIDGEFFLLPNHKHLLNKLDGKISPASARFLALKVADEQLPAVDEERLVLPLDSVATRITAWEDFILDNPQHLFVHDAEVQCSEYISLFISGTDDFPVFNLDNKSMQPEFKAAIERYLANNSTRKSYTIIKRFYDLAAETGFRYNDKIDHFLIDSGGQSE